MTDKKATITVDGVTHEFDDIEFRGSYIYLDGERLKRDDEFKGVIRVEITGTVNSVKSDRTVFVKGGNILGDAIGGESVSANTICGSVESGGTVMAANIIGDVKAGGEVKTNLITGNAKGKALLERWTDKYP